MRRGLICRILLLDWLPWAFWELMQLVYSQFGIVGVGIVFLLVLILLWFFWPRQLILFGIMISCLYAQVLVIEHWLEKPPEFDNCVFTILASVRNLVTHVSDWPDLLSALRDQMMQIATCAQR